MDKNAAPGADLKQDKVTVKVSSILCVVVRSLWQEAAG